MIFSVGSVPATAIRECEGKALPFVERSIQERSAPQAVSENADDPRRPSLTARPTPMRNVKAESKDSGRIGTP
jgi:hypothetical protein